jgi:putative ABC transport system permease protein
MLSPRWRKVLRDLWLNKTRTVLVVLSIAVGVFAVGTITNAQLILSRDLAASYAAINPAHATILTFDSFDDNLVKAVQGMRVVDEAEGRRNVIVRLKTGPNEWRNLMLVAIPDYNDIRIDKVWPEQGAWPPPKHELLLERAALGLAQANVGDTMLIKMPDGKERQVRVAGLAHDLYAQIYVFDGSAYGFITFDTLEWLGEPRDFNELRFTVADRSRVNDRQYIKAVANLVQNKVEQSGRNVLFTFIPEPGKHPLDFLIQAISLLLGVLGFLSLLLSGFLVVNTISAILAQQVRQIGLMKVVGGRTHQMMGMYLTMVLIFGLLALLLAVPLGAVGAQLFTSFMAGFLNFDIENFYVPLEVLMLEVGIGLIVPLLAALYPVIAGTRITVREAISTYGLGKGQFGSRRTDRLVQRIRGLSRPLLLSLRNTFRRRGRLMLTLTTLTLAGATFIAVFSVYASLLSTLDQWLAYFNYDVAVQFKRPYHIERVERETLQVPGVVSVESWAFSTVRRVRPDDSESDNIIVLAPPAASPMIKPVLVQGRWLWPEDTNALVVNTILLRDEPDVKVGGELVLKVEGRETKWHVVGLVEGGALIATAFANYPYFAYVTRDVGNTSYISIVTEQHDFAFQTQVAEALEKKYERAGLRVYVTAKISEERAETVAIFQVIVALLLIMAVLLAVVGGLGLMGTMSINVLERTREIGVIRAIGASDGAVLQIFMVEGILIGLISWLLGTLLAFPVSKLLSDTVGRQFLSVPLDYTFSSGGALLWLAVVVILAALASFLPAWQASRLTVREVLAYE